MPSTRPAGSPRSATKQQLIAAATEVVAQRGFHAASVDEIAKRAGFSVGALYGNFAGKDDLFFAVFDSHVAWFEQAVQRAAGAQEPAQAIAEWIGSLDAEPDQFLVFIEFWAYAVRKPKVKRRFAVRMAQMREHVSGTLERAAGAGESASPFPAGLTALLVLALGRGLAIEKLADPASVPDEAVAEIIVGLLGSARVQP